MTLIGPSGSTTELHPICPRPGMTAGEFGDLSPVLIEEVRLTVAEVKGKRAMDDVLKCGGSASKRFSLPQTQSRAGERRCEDARLE